MKFNAIIQARMGSTRLPGKIFLKIDEKFVIQSVIDQLSYSKMLTNCIIATTTNDEDHVVEEFSKKNHIDCFRGSSADVLDRYYKCAKEFSINTIVRITSDCPLINPDVVDRVLQFYKDGDFDYVSNISQKNQPYPSGTDVEVFTFNSLEKAWNNASKESEREHVTPYIYNNSDKFKIGTVTCPQIIPQLHYSVDRIEDLEFVRKMCKTISKSPILFEDICKVIIQNPHFMDINASVDPHEGYLKSLKNDNKTS